MNLLTIITNRSLMIAIKPKIIFSCYFVLVVCLEQSGGQFIGQQSTQFNNAQSNAQLSPQQQGHILSDIQLHQHRFNLNPNNQFNPQQFTTSNFHNQPQQQNFNQIQFPSPIQNQPQQTVLPAPVLQQSSIILPTNQPILTTVETPKNHIIQHHTQTSFTPNFAQQQQSFVQSIPNPTISPVVNPFQPRPTVDPILAIEQQIQLLDPEKHKQHIKELREKQAIIDKHNQFVERQYEKALKKAQADHQEFIEQQKEEKKKLYQRLYKPNEGQILRYTQSPPRYLYPEETPLFKLAVDKYYQEHPTTTTTTTTTTTPKPTSTTEKSLKIKVKSSFLPTALPSTIVDQKIKTIQTLDDLNQLRQQYKSQQIAKDDLLAQLRLAIGNNPIDENSNSRNVSSREISLANGKRVQVITTRDPKLIPTNSEPQEITLPNGQKVQVIKTTNPNLIASASTSTPTSSIKTQEITLPNGEKVEIIKTNDPKLVPGATPLEPGSDLEKLVLSRTTTTPKPPKILLDELTKSVIPPGANFELLKTDASGALEQVGGIPQNLPNKKKVTFVLLEEQDDGTLKVQGVRGSDNGKEKPDVDVDSILKKIKEGEIKLPNRVKTTTTTPRPATSTTIRTTTTTEGVDIVPNSFASEDDANLPILKTNIGTHFIATSTPSSTLYTKIFPNTVKATTPTPEVSTTIQPKRTREQHILNYPNHDLIRQASSASSANQNAIFNYPPPTGPPNIASTTVTIERSISSTLPTIPDFEQAQVQEDNDRKNLELTDVLKRNGLFAMAKFLKQSGLDTILNETGPYTIFVPNDKAFRTLLVQLGGPERAEEKFKENPRLLSGLLLHHVIPGAFTIGSLQDEMTGVSLAGTQLRVNQYSMHDLEWNDVKVTTINGAKILDDKKDIEIPQGIAHAVDRVMFPLPVGDIVQTLQSDRERRFTSLLRAIFASGLAETLQGTKTFTLFAPTDKAFMSLSTEDLNRMVTDKVLARELVFRHLIPTTLYTNGMRYYQIKESLLEDRQLTLSKQSGKVRVNNILLATQNIPATNGVIHAIDTLL